MKGGDFVDKIEVAFELTKLVSQKVLKNAEDKDFSNFDSAKSITDTFNKIYESLKIEK